MVNISNIAKQMPSSAIRKLAPFADAAKAEGIKVYHLNVGAPDIKSPECSLSAVKNNSLDHVSYSNSAGLMPLREGMVEKYYKKIGINIEVQELLITIGGSEAVNFALSICCDRGDEIIVMEPYYTNYSTFCFINGISLKSVRTNIKEGFKVPDMSEFEKLITPRTRAILLSNPGNPTGTLYTKEQMLALGELVKKYNLFLISDEVYREFCYTDEPHFSAMNIPGAEQNVIMVDSVSKRYNLCGCRIGNIVSHNKEVIAAALKYAQARLCPPIFGQLAALGALDTPKEYFDAVNKEYRKRRDYAVNTLNSIEGVFSPLPTGAFYTIAELPVDDGEAFAKWMLTDFRLNGETTMVTPAKSFYKSEDTGYNHIRVAYVLEVPELKKALNILSEGLKAYPGRTK